MKSIITFLTAYLLICKLNAQVFTSFPDNIEPDSIHAPFYHGIASGDPLLDKVIIWSRFTPNDISVNSSHSIKWEIAEDQNFTNIIDSGFFVTDSSRDWTIKVDVDNLMPGRFYYYRFKDVNNRYSAVGRTKTLPANEIDKIKLGVGSCANIFHGYFNAYEAMAERDLDAVIYLGDFIYNNDGSNSKIRWPEPDPWQINDEYPIRDWYDRHAYYHFDVDFRKVLASHPAIVIWDNHDVHQSFYEPAIQAWLNWVPIRENATDQNIIYRQFNFGNLLSLNMVDVNAFKEIDTLPNGEFSFLGNEQFSWLTDNLIHSSTIWNLIGQQKNFTSWSVGEQIGNLLDLDNNEIGEANWSARPASRQQLKDFLMENDIPNLMILSGDAHVANVSDIDPNLDNANDYNGNTGEGSIGVEFLPSGITSSNLDERFLPAWVEDIIVAISLNINPHQIYVDLINHGYGILEINQDSITASICYNNIKRDTENEWCFEFVMYNGTNHWRRHGQSYNADVSTATIYNNSIKDVLINRIYPNPTSDVLFLEIQSDKIVNIKIEMFDFQGNEYVTYKKTNHLLVNGLNTLMLSTADMPSGKYFLSFEIEGNRSIRQILINK